MQKSKPFDEAELGTPNPNDWERTCFETLNNFGMHFPWGDVPVHTDKPEGRYRSQTRELGWWDKRYTEVMTTDDLQYYTELRCRQTSADFYALLDKTATQELGIPMTRISEVINRAYLQRNRTEEQKQEAFRAVYDLLLPIYVAMRKKGYNRLDTRG